VSTSWKDPGKVAEYVGRVDRLAARAAGESELVEALPSNVKRVLDLGCGDGRLIALVMEARPDLAEALARVDARRRAGAGRLTTGQAAPRRSHRLPAMSTNTATRP